MTKGRRLLITCVQMQNAIPHLQTEVDRAGVELELATIRGQQMSEVELLPIIGGYDGVIAGDDSFTRAVLAAASRLRVVSKWGVGLDSIDRVAAEELGIVVTNTPNMFDAEVADVTIGYMILLARQLHVIDRQVREGAWPKIEGRSLAGMELGVVGLGGIGLETARRGIVMGMQVRGADPDPVAAARAEGLGVRTAPFDELARSVDILAFNCPLNDATRRMLDARAIASIRPGLLLVNTARGGVIDEPALIEALMSGTVGGAALDVFEQEPLPEQSPLRSMSNVVLGSHNSSNTREAVLRTSALALENALEHLG